MKQINKILCSNFIKLIGASEKEKAEENIPKLVLLLTKGGKELEYIMIKAKEDLIAIVIQVAATMAMGNEIIFSKDWDMESNESNETEEPDELHYKIYDKMNEITCGNWKDYFPETNILWFGYLIEKAARM
uniref:Non-specific serine/threonine protein kinase n=1 Tax=Panagrolaimus sp. PS1159 TaxID=55785 RepID=A0AC35GBQ7_9BILA